MVLNITEWACEQTSLFISRFMKKCLNTGKLLQYLTQNQMEVLPCLVYSTANECVAVELQEPLELFKPETGKYASTLANSSEELSEHMSTLLTQLNVNVSEINGAESYCVDTVEISNNLKFMFTNEI
ncbi:Hypothetical_protein [Hexamita inflata]|uniref:Hypothetical_protein n=1 Tax=Hexamita inflata TaxID=28002 RepID=A0AA86U3V0_9EUKA|nr:Hypothetical protein HINF_LOCUS24617 [Hexamita inflata]